MEATPSTSLENITEENIDKFGEKDAAKSEDHLSTMPTVLNHCEQ